LSHLQGDEIQGYLQRDGTSENKSETAVVSHQLVTAGSRVQSLVLPHEFMVDIGWEQLLSEYCDPRLSELLRRA
jgi:hypothetical protein